MKASLSSRWATLACFGILSAGTATAAMPELAAGVRIMDGSYVIAVDGGQSAPEVADWNNDGKPDLLVGQFTGGKTRLYLNKGAPTAPCFDGYSYIQSGGTDIATAYG